MRNYTKLLSIAGLACLPGFALADDTAAPLTGVAKVLDESGITASGYLSASYQANFNKGSTLGGRAFDSKTDSFTFNQAALTVSKLPEQGFGGLVNIIAGDDAQVINATYGDGNSKFNLTQAYLQYAIGGLTVIGGRFVTLSGYEVINDAATPHISRSYLFQNVEPLVHTGLRASYKLNDLITGYLGVNNTVYDGVSTDSNKQKTIEAGVALAPLANLSVGLYNYYGVDSVNANNYLDLVVAYTATDKLTLALNGDYYRAFSSTASPGAEVKGVAFYGAYQVTDLIGVRGRFEYVADGFNTTSDKSAKIKTLTGTVVVSPAKSFDILGEVRYDIAGKSQPIFPDGANTKDTQGDVAVKVIYKF